MANTEKGEVGFEALGESWILRFSTNALCEIEDATGRSAIALANSLDDEDNVKMSDIRLMFWAGLTENHDEVDLKTAGKIIDNLGPQAGVYIGQALLAAFPEAGESTKGKQKKGSNGGNIKSHGRRRGVARNNSGG